MRNQIFREGFDCGYKLGIKQGKGLHLMYGFLVGTVISLIIFLILTF